MNCNYCEEGPCEGFCSPREDRLKPSIKIIKIKQEVKKKDIGERTIKTKGR